MDRIVLLPSSGARFLAMGAQDYCPSYCQTSTWFLLTSLDGVSWTVLGQLPGEPNMISTVFDSEFGYFAGGSIEPDGVEGPLGIWWSKDGTDWTSLADEDAFQPSACRSARRGEILEFYSTDDGLVASGTGRWFSTDGKHWQCKDDQVLYQVAAGKTGYVGIGDGPDPESATLWSSTDGLDWSQSQTVPAKVDVASVAAGFVAVADPAEMGVQLLFLTSADGRQWTERDYPFGSDEGSGLTSDGNRAAAISDPQDGDLWVSSPDGTAWNSFKLPIGDGDEVDDEIAVLGSTVVVGGASKLGGPVLWVAQIP